MSDLPVILVTVENESPGILETNIFVLPIFYFNKFSIGTHFLRKILVRIEVFISRNFYKRRYSRLESFGNQNAISGIFLSALTQKILKIIQPQVIICHQLIRYGYILTQYKKCKRYIRPYGQDLFLYSSSSPFLNIYTRYILNNVTGFILFSSYSKNYIREKFLNTSTPISYVCDGIDSIEINTYNDHIEEEISKLLLQNLNYSESDNLFINLRRFQKGWGIDILTDSIIEILNKNDKSKFILISGAYNYGNKAYLDRLNEYIFKKRIWLIDRHIPEEMYIALLKMSNFGISIMESGDMRSHSIMLAAKYGLPIVMNYSDEFKLLENIGFRAFFVSEYSSKSLTKTVLSALSDEETKINHIESNYQFIYYLKKNGINLTDIYKSILNEL